MAIHSLRSDSTLFLRVPSSCPNRGRGLRLRCILSQSILLWVREGSFLFLLVRDYGDFSIGLSVLYGERTLRLTRCVQGRGDECVLPRHFYRQSSLSVSFVGDCSLTLGYVGGATTSRGLQGLVRDDLSFSGLGAVSRVLGLRVLAYYGTRLAAFVVVDGVANSMR